MAELTRLIQQAVQGDEQAREQVFAALYADLRKIARARLSRSQSSTFLDTTALIHEAYLRLTSVGSLRVEDRHSYLGYASRVMRSVVVDFVRARAAERRGGDLERITLNTAIGDGSPSGEEEILRVHEALDELAQVDERMVRIVEMRYFAGLSELEVAQALGIHERTVRRSWAKARLMLAAVLG